MRQTVLAVLTCAMLAGCQSPGVGPSSPVPGAPPSAPATPYRVGDADLRKARAIHEKALEKGLVYAPGENPVATRYVDRVVANISAQRPPGSAPLRGFIVKDDDVNAFTTGTGYLYFNRGLLKALDNEAQLAMVAAHEAAHVDAGHLPQGNQTRATVDALTSLGAAVLDGVGGLGGTLGKIGVGLAGRRANAFYSQGHELEADDIGLAYVLRAGYDGQQAASAFRVLAAANGSRGGLAELFSSHPASAGRFQAIAAKAAASGQRGGFVGGDDYARMVATLGGPR